jgi:preprotein translocase subunit SecG
MYAALLIVHILVCVFLIIVVLLQSGKAADLAGAFGGMGSQTAFGPRGSATLLSKATTVSAVVFMLTSLSLSVVATRQAGLSATVLQDTTRSAPAKSQPASGSSKTTLPVPGQTGQPAPSPAPAPSQPAAGQGGQQAPATGGNNTTFPLPSAPAPDPAPPPSQSVPKK